MVFLMLSSGLGVGSGEGGAAACPPFALGCGCVGDAAAADVCADKCILRKLGHAQGLAGPLLLLR